MHDRSDWELPQTTTVIDKIVMSESSSKTVQYLIQCPNGYTASQH